MLHYLRNKGATRLIALTLALHLVACSPNYTYTEHITRAKDFISKEDYKAASVELANAVAKDPKAAQGRWLRAQVLAELGDFPGAEKEARKAQELGYPITEIQPLLARAILQQGDWDRALSETKKIQGLPTTEEKATLLALRGQAHLLKGEFDQAKQAFEQVLQIKSDTVDALVGMAALHGFKRNYDAARPWIDRALISAPKSASAWSAKGDLELAQDNYTKAEEAFTNAMKYYHFFTPDTAKRAFSRLRLGKIIEAKADIDMLINSGLGKGPFVNYVHGRIYYAENKYDKAAAALEQSINADPSQYAARLYLAASYHFLGQQEKALTYAKQLYGAIPRHLPTQQLLSGIHLSRGEYDQAQAILSKSLGESPSDVTLLNQMVSLSIAEGKKAQGIEYAGKAIAIAPESARAHDQLIISKLIAGEPIDKIRPTQAGLKNDPDALYKFAFFSILQTLRDKNNDKALDLSRKLQAQYPNKLETNNMVGAVYLRMNRLNEAKVEFLKANRINPNDPSSTRAIAMIDTLKGDMPSARDRLSNYMAAVPGDEQAAIMLATVQSRLGNAAAGISVLEAIIQRNPQAVQARLRLATQFLQAENHLKVIAITNAIDDSVLRKAPAFLELRGKALMLSGDANSAHKAFERWKDLEPTSAAAHFYYSDSLARIGKTGAARAELERAIALNPRYLPARLGGIKMLVQAKQIEKARQALKKLHADFGDRAEVLGLDGWFNLGTGNYAAAETALSAANKKSPDTETTILLVRAQWAQNMHDKAFTTMQNWLSGHPKDLVMLLQQAGAYLSLKRNDEARGVYAKIVSYYPNHLAALNNLAWLEQDRDLSQAIKHALNAQAIAPSDPYVKDTLGILMLKRGDVGQAGKLHQEAAKLAPDDPSIQLHWAQYLVSQKRFAESRKVLQGMLKNAASTPQAQEAKQLLETLAASQDK